MINIKSFLIVAFIIISAFGFAQNSYQSMNNTMLIQRQQMAAARESQRFGLSLAANHSKFIAPKQKELNLFNKLLIKNEKKIAELEAEIAEETTSLESSDDKEKIGKKIKRKEFWLKVARNEKIKFKTAISKLEAEIAVSENK